MVVDSSAIVAVILGEAERHIFLQLLMNASQLSLSAVTHYETSIVVAGAKGDRSATRFVDEFIEQYEMEIVPADRNVALAAREAYFQFGRGYHPAKLNFGDCFSYALAKARNDTLLFKGDDFLKTDIVPARRP